jgi:putative ABC transport system permease protein
VAVPIAYSLASLGVRWKSTLLTVIGIALVVAVFIALLAMASGFRFALSASGSEGNALVLQKGALSELGSSFSEAAGDWVAGDARVEHGSDGTPLVSPELVLVVALPRRSDGQLTNLGVRGVTTAAFRLRRGVTLLEGRRPHTGLSEIIVGRRAQRLIEGLAVGSRISLLRHPFKVVGVFSDEGSSLESELWGDFAAMASAFNRAGTESSLTVRLRNPQALPAFDGDLRANLQYPLTMTGEREYYEGQAGRLVGFLRSLAVFVGVVTGIGAVFAAMNTMYAIVASRTREIGTLRALGFSRRAILMAFVLEGLILATAGGFLGCLLSLLTNGLGGSAWASLGDVSFAFRVTPADLGWGLLFAAAMGVVGSLLPAGRAARLPLTFALRQG